jgi:imidazolonepropionase-like amidohydrolase
MRPKWILLFLIVTLAGAASPARSQDAGAHLYTGFVLINPETATRTENAWLIVRGRRIEAMGAGTPPRGDFDRHDMRGMYAMPGLIDAHAHITSGPQRISVVDGKVRVEVTAGDEFSQSNAAIALAFGVTSVRNPGSSTAASERYDDMIAEGRWIGPEARHAGAVIEPPPFVGESFVYPESAEAWDAEAARQAAAGMTYFKLYTDLTERELAAGVAAARAHGLIPIAHLNAVSWTRALELGVQQFEHALPTSPALLEPNVRDSYVYGADFMTRWWELADLDGPLLQNLARALADADVAVDLTLSVNQMVYFADEWESVIPERVNPPDYVHPAQVASQAPSDAAIRGAQPEVLARGKAVWPRVLGFARMLHDAGVPLMIGTDGNGGLGLSRELENHVLAGIPVWEVLRMATSGNADLIGLPGIGRLAPGSEADIVFLEADPAADVRNVARVAFVVNNGVLFKQEDVLQVARAIAVAARAGPAQLSSGAR